MNKTLEDVWFEKMEQANMDGLNVFAFKYKGGLFVSEWLNGKWSSPLKVNLL